MKKIIIIFLFCILNINVYAQSADCNYQTGNYSVKIKVNNKLQVSATGITETTNKYSNYKYKIIFDESNVLDSNNKISLPDTIWYFWYPSTSYNSSTTWYLGLYKSDIQKAAKLEDKKESKMKSVQLKKDEKNCKINNDTKDNDTNDDNKSDDSINDFKMKKISNTDPKYCNYKTDNGEKIVLSNNGYVYEFGDYSQDVASQNTDYAARASLTKDIFSNCPNKLYYNCMNKSYTGFCSISLNEETNSAILTYIDDKSPDSSEEVKKAQDKENRIDINDVTGETTSGCAIFGDDTTKIIKWAYKLLKIGAPLLVVVFGILDFVRSLLNGEDKGFKEAWQRFIKRLIAAIVVILLPVLLTFILNLSGVLKQYGIDTSDDIYCIFK